MIYIILDKDKDNRIMLVKAETKEEVDERINFKGGQCIAAVFSETEVIGLCNSVFGVISY